MNEREYFMLWIFIVCSLLTAMEFYDYYVLRGQTGWKRLAGLFVIVCITCTLPFLVPANLVVTRFFIALIVFNKIVKSLEIAYNRVYDPEMLASFGRFLFWSFNFPDSTWPKTPEDVKSARIDGLKRLLRSFIKALCIVGLWGLWKTVPWISANYWLQTLWILFFTYCGFSGFIDMVTGTIMQTGIPLNPLFNMPLLGRSPREFWGRRWNLYFRDVTHRNVFLPLGGEKRPLFAVCAVFAVSALLHEYLIFVCIGGGMLGYMSSFFALQCFATIFQTMIGKWTGKKKIFPQPVAILLHTLWMVLTSPLLIEPMLKIFPLSMLP